MTELRSMGLWAKCPEYGHTWVAAGFPAPLEEVAKAAMNNSICDKCGGHAVVARQQSGYLLEKDNG